MLLSRLRRALLLVAFAGGSELCGQDATVALPAVIVTADRLPATAPDEPFPSVRIDGDTLRRAPQLRLDDILRNEVPGFSLFRRSSSRVANPTTQGVTLRNLGPNGAGRTLVLFDGIPLNDPFAGWVPWARIPPASIGEILVNPGGGAGLFGNAALAGTIHILPRERTGNGARITGTLGERDTSEASLDARIEAERFALSGFVNRFSTGGYPVLQPNQRGPIDTSASSDAWLWQSRLDWQPDELTRLRLSASAFEEDRNNGTLFTRNSTRGQDFSFSAQRWAPTLDVEVRAQAYLQRRHYRSTFSAVNPERTFETPALDQFDVPATAAGGSLVWSQSLNLAHQIVGGVDARWIEGETNESYFRVGNDFTRVRNAGGRQLLLGIFLEENWQATEAVRIVAGGRLDYWRQFDGLRVERDRLSSATLRSTEFAEQDGWAPNARLGVTAQITRSLRVRGAGYSGFRVPTLNELYRPFRVGNDITEANAELDPERLLGAELGVDWEPVERFAFTVTAFANQLRNAVGNVTIGEGPGFFEPGGFVPAGGVLRQRQNLDRVAVLGLETKLTWALRDHLRLRGHYLFTHATITDANAARQLEGKRLAQAPEHVAVTALDWTPGRWQASAQVRYVGRQFEDDLNSLPLAHFATIDVALGYAFNEHLTAVARIENLFDHEIEIGKTASGLVSIGPPRLFSLTVALEF